MGDFSYYINKYFPNQTLYLFDTFEGFDKRDLEAERKLKEDAFLNGLFNNTQCFSSNSEYIAVNRMLHPEKCVVKKGYFPGTAEGVNDTFCFVSLDMDLYQPMLEGIRFFYERMCPGGTILLHDYFYPQLPGVKRAVADFEQEHGPVCKLPIGDFWSLAIIK